MTQNASEPTTTVLSQLLSGTAQSIEKLMSVVISSKTNDMGSKNEPDDDDWLFCKRMYNKLRAIPDSQQKEWFKLNMDSELIKMTYGSTCEPRANMSTEYGSIGYDGSYLQRL